MEESKQNKDGKQNEDLNTILED